MHCDDKRTAHALREEIRGMLKDAAASDLDRGRLCALRDALDQYLEMTGEGAQRT